MYSISKFFVILHHVKVFVYSNNFKYHCVNFDYTSYIFSNSLKISKTIQLIRISFKKSINICSFLSVFLKIKTFFLSTLKFLNICLLITRICINYWIFDCLQYLDKPSQVLNICLLLYVLVVVVVVCSALYEPLSQPFSGCGTVYISLLLHLDPCTVNNYPEFLTNICTLLTFQDVFA